MPLANLKIGFLGGGAMAFSIASGLVNKGTIKSNQIGASGPHMDNLKHWKEMGAFITSDNNELLSKYDIIFICVKPKVLEPCFNVIKNSYKTTDTSQLFISVLAGVTLDKLQETLDFIPKAKVIRTMPNTSVQIGEGCVVYTAGCYVTESDLMKAKMMFDSLGLAQEVPEQLIDPITGIAGCGPAFVYTIIEGLADGAVKQGVPKQMALQFTAQTLLGASKTILLTKKHPAILRDEVCSPGGSTICGIHELEKGSLRSTLMNAVEKSVEKSRLLGNIK